MSIAITDSASYKNAFEMFEKQDPGAYVWRHEWTRQEFMSQFDAKTPFHVKDELASGFALLYDLVAGNGDENDMHYPALAYVIYQYHEAYRVDTKKAREYLKNRILLAA